MRTYDAVEVNDELNYLFVCVDGRRMHYTCDLAVVAAAEQATSSCAPRLNFFPTADELGGTNIDRIVRSSNGTYAFESCEGPTVRNTKLAGTIHYPTVVCLDGEGGPHTGYLYTMHAFHV